MSFPNRPFKLIVIQPKAPAPVADAAAATQAKLSSTQKVLHRVGKGRGKRLNTKHMSEIRDVMAQFSSWSGW